MNFNEIIEVTKKSKFLITCIVSIITAIVVFTNLTTKYLKTFNDMSTNILNLSSEINELKFTLVLSKVEDDIYKSRYQRVLDTIIEWIPDEDTFDPSLKDEDIARLFRYRGDAYYGMEQCSDKARNAYKNAITHSNNYPMMKADAIIAKSRVVVACHDSVDWTDAITELLEIKDKRATEARLNIALLNLLIEEYDEAKKMYDAIIKEIGKGTKNPEVCIAACIGRGISYALRPNGNIKNAILEFKKVIKAYPQSREIFQHNIKDKMRLEYNYQRYSEFLEELSSKFYEEYKAFLENI